MANNKRGQGLVKPARSIVKDDKWEMIDALIGEIDKPIQDDEFTVADYVSRIEAKGGTLSESQAYKQLMAKVKLGVLTSRKTSTKTSRMNVFKFV